MSKINHNRNSTKLQGKQKEGLEFLDVSTELNIGFKKQFRERLRERKKEKEQEQLRIKSIFKKGQPKLIRKGKVLD